KTPRDFHRRLLVLIADAQEHRALHGQFLSSAQLCLGEGFAEILAYAHYFTGRTHFRTENHIHARELRKGKYRGLHETWRTRELSRRVAEFGELAAEHQA